MRADSGRAIVLVEIRVNVVLNDGVVGLVKKHRLRLHFGGLARLYALGPRVLGCQVSRHPTLVEPRAIPGAAAAFIGVLLGAALGADGPHCARN